MTDTVKPVVVFHGKNELEAQMARDALVAAEIPVLHLPSLSTGIFGVAQTTRVAVAEELAEDALEVLAEAGFTGAVESLPHGLEAFDDAFREAFPARTPGRPDWRSHLFQARAVIGLLILALVAYLFLKGR